MADDLRDKLDPTTHPSWYKLDWQSDLTREGDVWADGSPLTEGYIGYNIAKTANIYRHKDRSDKALCEAERRDLFEPYVGNPDYQPVMRELKPGEEPGRKDDKDKARYDLVPWETMPGIAAVLTHGASKYGPENWRKVEQAKARYLAAFHRHFTEQWLVKGLAKDEDGTGLDNLAQAITCLMFIYALELAKGKAR